MTSLKSIGQINLASSSDLHPLRVDFERFLAFSYEMAESLQDLLAKYRNDSVQTNWSLYHAVRRTASAMENKPGGDQFARNYQSNATPADFTPNG
ncbi:MAG TPA: hypothetical protein PKD54_08900 [Pirellulaceae bacterium]|nr:hypothetical protein [Pirellulaceae bacterium]